MRVITWNIQRANSDSTTWDSLLSLKPDIVLTQEAGAFPEKILDEFDVLSRFATYKNGKPQRFQTAVLVKGMILEDIELKSEYDWVNRELDFFRGNLIYCKVELKNRARFNVVSVYSPA